MNDELQDLYWNKGLYELLEERDKRIRELEERVLKLEKAIHNHFMSIARLSSSIKPLNPEDDGC